MASGFGGSGLRSTEIEGVGFRVEQGLRGRLGGSLGCRVQRSIKTSENLRVEG